MTVRNLFLVAYDDHRMAESLAEVGRHAREAAPEIRSFVIVDRPYRFHRFARALRPSLYFAPAVTRRLRPLRGAVLQGRSMAKSAQYEALEAVGVPVPRWARLTEREVPDLAEWPAYVVVKPDFGRRGAAVRIMRRERVRWEPIESPIFPGNTDLIVQEFIYTGRWPVCYRVSTLFGEPLYALRAEGSRGKRPLEARDAFGDGGHAIRSSTAESTWSLCDDGDIIDLARRAHKALSHVVRDDGTGALAVLETNPAGWTWQFRTVMSEALRREHGLDLEAQYDGLRVAGSLLAERTRRLAR